MPYFEVNFDTLVTLIAFAVLVIIISMYYFAEDEYIPPNESFDDVMDEVAPEEHACIKLLRIRRQQIEAEISAIDARVLEIQNTDLKGHSSAYFTAEMNKLATKRSAIKNRLDLAVMEEIKAGEDAGKFVDEVNKMDSDI